MSGKEILVDTNIILYLLNGSETLANFLQGKNIYFSFITELELIDFKENKSEELQISELLDDCSIIQLNEKIKAKYKYVRKKYRLKLADAIIAATALAHNLPLITADTGFKVVEEIDLILIEK